MAQYDANQATTTTSTVANFSVTPVALDAPNSEGETTYDFPNATKYLGYYKKIPELKKAVDNLAIWTVGKGLVCDSLTQVTLDHIKGWGEDSFQSILENMIVVKKIVGDSFAEIIEDERTGKVINLKPISPERMKIVVNKAGLIIRYEHLSKGGWVNLKPEKVLHLCNDRVADEIHGTSVIEACQWVIDARNEALADERMIKHRELAMGILYVDTDDTAKLTKVKEQYADAVKKGEVLVLPKDAAELKDSGVKPQDRLAWIAYLENFFYQAVGIPRVIASSQEYTEAASKVGYMTFEPVYTREQTLLESDLWNKLYIKVKFNRPPSLSGVVQEDEAKNTGQTGFQPSEVTGTAGRVE